MYWLYSTLDELHLTGKFPLAGVVRTSTSEDCRMLYPNLKLKMVAIFLKNHFFSGRRPPRLSSEHMHASGATIHNYDP